MYGFLRHPSQEMVAVDFGKVTSIEKKTTTTTKKNSEAQVLVLT